MTSTGPVISEVKPMFANFDAWCVIVYHNDHMPHVEGPMSAKAASAVVEHYETCGRAAKILMLFSRGTAPNDIETTITVTTPPTSPTAA